LAKVYRRNQYIPTGATQPVRYSTSKGNKILLSKINYCVVYIADCLVFRQKLLTT